MLETGHTGEGQKQSNVKCGLIWFMEICQIRSQWGKSTRPAKALAFVRLLTQVAGPAIHISDSPATPPALPPRTQSRLWHDFVC